MMENSFLRIKISVLWILMDFALLLLLTLNDLDPNGGLRQVIAGFPQQLVPEVLLGGAIILLVPFVMAFLSLTLKDPSSRRANLILGVVFTIFQLSGVGYALSRLAMSYAYLTLMQAAAFAPPVLIVWYAHNWPKGDFNG